MAAAASAVASATETPAPASGAPSSRPTRVADPAAARTAPRTPPPKPKDDALDLGATVLPILAKTYWKQAAAAVLGVLILWRLLHRRR